MKSVWNINKHMIFHQDNIRLYVSMMTRQKLLQLGWKFLIYLLYSSDILYLWIFIYYGLYKILLIGEDGCEIGGSEVQFPSTPVKYIADLRSRANSQQYSSIYEDQRPKIEDIERSDGEKSA